MITTISSRDFNQDTGKAKTAARKGPVVITDRGRPSHVFLSYDDYKRLSGADKPIGELLALPGMEDLELDIPTFRDLPKALDFS